MKHQSEAFVALDTAKSDTNSIMRGIEYIRLTGTAGTYVRTAMRLMALDGPLP
jgi:hypothetical protein